MSKQKQLRPIGEVIRSPRFLKEISILLFFFAALQVFSSIVVLAGDTTSPGALFTLMEGLIVAVINVVLAILIRNGSFTALVVTGLLFVADMLIVLFGPYWEMARGVLLVRGFLIFILISFIQRQRRIMPSEIQN